MNYKTAKPKEAMQLEPLEFIKWLTCHRGGHARELKAWCDRYLGLRLNPQMIEADSRRDASTQVAQPVQDAAGDGLLSPAQRADVVQACNAEPRPLRVSGELPEGFKPSRHWQLMPVPRDPYPGPEEHEG